MNLVYESVVTKNFDEFSTEILLNIFAYLNIKELVYCGAVCQKFRQIVHDNTLWLKFNFFHKKIPKEFLKQALVHGTKYLCLQNAELWGSNSNFKKINQIKYLNLYNSSGYEEILGW